MSRAAAAATLRIMTLLVSVWLTVACDSSGSSDSFASSGSGSTAPLGAKSLVSAPTVTGPIEGGLRGRPWAAPVEALTGIESSEYVVEEYFVSGHAPGRDPTGVLNGSSADYQTRILIVRPENPARFNGSVLVEWFNVTAEMELPVIFGMGYREILRDGYAYVGVSAQAVGVSTSPLALKVWDPLRYLPLQHPGDAYALDLYAQVAKSLFARQGPAPLGSLQPRRVIAMGESQSGAYMAIYANAVQRDHQVFDGIFVHTWPKEIEADPGVPVLMLLTEAEIEGVVSPGGGTGGGSGADGLGDVPGLGLFRVLNAGYPSADASYLRVWELAGGSHYDQESIYYQSAQISRDLNSPAALPLFFRIPFLCGYPPNQLGIGRPVMAAIRSLDRWIATGQAPPSLPRVARADDGSIVRDADGLAQGGIRMPNVAEPVAVLRGDDCLFFGSTRAFSPADVRSRYASRQDYLTRFRAAALRNVDEGSLLSPEADAYIEEAEIAADTFWAD